MEGESHPAGEYPRVLGICKLILARPEISNNRDAGSILRRHSDRKPPARAFPSRISATGQTIRRHLRA
jgi:hypothetical protein